MYKYTLAVTSPEYWNTIHNALTVDSNEDGIPDRKVTCCDTKEHSPTRGTYWLTEAEATGISTHPQVKWIELSPSDYPHSYPLPEPDTKRFRKNVKIYRDLSYSAFSISATSAEENRTNWAMKRIGVTTNGDSWPNVTGNAAVINDDLSYSLTGKNVDLIIHDSGILQYHPEFLGDDGKSRVRDVVLDGPYYIDPSYFTSNSHTYTKPDGRIGITTASAHAWWENSSSRSGAFSSVGTVAIPNNYTVANTLGIGGTSHTMTSSHGTGCAGLSAGKNFGLAFESNIWNMSVVGSPSGMGVEASYDIMKIFHQNKPTNTATGRKNPTVVNGSWGYFAGFNSGTTVSYSFKGSSGTFTGYASNSTGVQAMAYGLNGGTSYNRQFATSSRSNSTETAGDEMVNAGVIYVTSAGNSNQRLGLGLNDPHLNDYLTTLNSADTRSGVPGANVSGTVPSGHRNWIHPANIGYNATTDYHPAICVGAMDDFIESNYQERKASYSNNGPGVDVWAPADETLSAGMRAANGDQLGSELNFSRYNSNFVDRYFNGTSAASPVVAGVVALFLESKPNATSAEVKDFIRTQGSQMLPDSEWLNPYPTDNNAEYWRDDFNNRGAANRVIYDPTATDARPTFANASGGENIITSGLVLNLDGNNYTSGTTWTDTSGQGNNGTLVGGTGYSSDNGGYLIFDGTNDYVNITSLPVISNTSAMTMEAWVNVDNLDNEYQCIGTWERTTRHWQFTYSGDSSYNLNMSIAGSNYSVGTTAAPATGVWQCVAVTFTGGAESSFNTSTTSIYVNGVSQSIQNTGGTGTSGNDSYIGTRQGFASSNFLDGSMALIRYYDKALTEAEIRHNFDAMKGRFENRPLILSGISYSLT